MKSKKKPFKEVEDALHEICIMEIGEEYRILQQSDDGGNHIVVAFENKLPANTRDLISTPYMGWRTMFLICPEGYLSVFHPLQKS